MQRIRTSESGFTLIEIAIVLVIIGLLLGGILKGQELITSARVRALADQNSGIQAAYYGFVDRYRKIPGDMRATEADQAIPGASIKVGGNGNGRIDAVGGSEWTEPLALWVHLSAAGFIQGSYVGGTSAPDQESEAPRNVYSNFLVLGRSSDYLDVSATPPERMNLVVGRGVPVGVLRELDVKVDDGFPATGVLRFTTTGGDAKFGSVSASADCVGRDSDPKIWNIDGDQSDCNATYLW